MLAEQKFSFQTNFADVQQRKSAKYYALLETCTANDHTTTLVMIEVESREVRLFNKGLIREGGKPIPAL